MVPPWNVEMKICSNVPSHMTKMASRPICGKILQKSPSSEPRGWLPWNLVYSIRYSNTTKFVQMMTLATQCHQLTIFITWSNLFPNDSAWVKAYTAYGHVHFPSGWLGQAMVRGSFQCRGVLLLWHMVGQGPVVLAAGAGCVGICFFLFFHLVCPIFLFLCLMSLETTWHTEILWSRLL